MKTVKLLEGPQFHGKTVKSENRTSRFNWRSDAMLRIRRERETMPVLALLNVKWSA